MLTRLFPFSEMVLRGLQENVAKQWEENQWKINHGKDGRKKKQSRPASQSARRLGDVSGHVSPSSPDDPSSRPFFFSLEFKIMYTFYLPIDFKVKPFGVVPGPRLDSPLVCVSCVWVKMVVS